MLSDVDHRSQWQKLMSFVGMGLNVAVLTLVRQFFSAPYLSILRLLRTSRSSIMGFAPMKNPNSVKKSEKNTLFIRPRLDAAAAVNCLPTIEFVFETVPS